MKKDAKARGGRFAWSDGDIKIGPPKKRLAFCPTGPGGGVDPSCSPGEGGGGDGSDDDPRQEQWDREDAEIESRRDKEDEQRESRRDEIQGRVEGKREREDAQIERQRGKEDAEWDKKVEKHDRETEKIDRQRDKESARVERQRDKEDRERDRQRDKESAERWQSLEDLNEAQEGRIQRGEITQEEAQKEYDALESKLEDEAEAAGEANDAEDERIAAERKKEDRETAERYEKEDAARAAAWEEQEEAYGQLLEDREIEDEERQKRREEEDRITQEQWNKEDEEIAARREIEDMELARAREGGLSVKKKVMEFNPDQPRDERGRWGSGGGGSKKESVGERVKGYKKGEEVRQQVLKQGERTERAEAAYQAATKEHSDYLSTYQKDPENPQVRQKMAELSAKADAAYEANREARQQAREQAHAALRSDNPVEVSTTYSRVGAEQRAAAEEGIGFARSISGREGDPEISVAVSRKNSRADWTQGENGGRMRLSNNSPAIAAHEMGHALEDNLPGAREAAAEFWEHRFGGETPTNLNQRFGGQFGEGESGRRDGFGNTFTTTDESASYYVGRRYPDGGTELLSMGVEQLYRDPVGMARRDPEYFNWTLGVLRGDLR